MSYPQEFFIINGENLSKIFENMKFMIEKPTDCLFSKMLNCTESQVSIPYVFIERSAKASVAFMLN